VNTELYGLVFIVAPRMRKLSNEWDSYWPKKCRSTISIGPKRTYNSDFGANLVGAKALK
jgi:hypothetical protein